MGCAQFGQSWLSQVFLQLLLLSVCYCKAEDEAVAFESFDNATGADLNSVGRQNPGEHCRLWHVVVIWPCRYSWVNC